MQGILGRYTSQHTTNQINGCWPTLLHYDFPRLLGGGGNTNIGSIMTQFKVWSHARAARVSYRVSHAGAAHQPLAARRRFRTRRPRGCDARLRGAGTAVALGGNKAPSHPEPGHLVIRQGECAVARDHPSHDDGVGPRLLLGGQPTSRRAEPKEKQAKVRKVRRALIRAEPKENKQR